MMRSHGLVCIGVFIALYVVFYLDFVDITLEPLKSNVNSSEDRRSARGSPYYDAIFDTCVLKEYPAWTPAMQKLLTPNYDPMKGCDRNWVPRTILGEDGIVRLHPKYRNMTDEKCWARAILLQSEYKIKKGAWHTLDENYTFENDIVETTCTNKTNKTTYTYLHYQVYRKREPPAEESDPTPSESSEEEPAEPFKPSVYVILFDSIAATQALRTFPKTVKFLESDLEAIRFRHINKVGENSRPNGVALFFGKLITYLNREVYGLPTVEPDWEYDKFCKSFLDDDDFVISDYEKLRGYTTFMAEDWDKGVFNWPSCYGFKKQPTTHYMRPFQIRLLKDTTPNLKTTMSPKRCHEHHKYLLNYLDKFIDAYPDKPKFALSWASYLGHDYANVPFHADQYIFDFFMKNKEEFDKSYVFFMGDHGLRFGKVRWTELGMLEVNNPMLWLSVPRELRGNQQLMQNMRDNAGKLLTMFDTHATFVDILKVLPQSNFTEYSAVPMQPGTQGHSIFRPLPDTPRNCKTLPIPPQFCICDLPKTPTEDVRILSSVGTVIVDAINKQLRVNNVTHLCHIVEEEGVKDVMRLNHTENIYEAKVLVTPGKGEYVALLRNIGNETNPEFVTLVPDITRMNSYGHSADCIKMNFLRPYCYCKDFEAKQAKEKAAKEAAKKNRNKKNSKKKAMLKPEKKNRTTLVDGGTSDHVTSTTTTTEQSAVGPGTTALEDSGITVAMTNLAVNTES